MVKMFPIQVAELAIVHCNIFNNHYGRDSRILYTFLPNKPFGSLLEISPPNHIFLKTFNSEFQEIKIFFTDQAGKPLEVEDKINLTMILNSKDKMQFPLHKNELFN